MLEFYWATPEPTPAEQEALDATQTGTLT